MIYALAKGIFLFHFLEVTMADSNSGTGSYLNLSNLCLALGFISIAGSIFIWNYHKDADAGHAERFGIFVGLWAPTFMILSSRLHHPYK